MWPLRPKPPPAHRGGPSAPPHKRGPLAAALDHFRFSGILLRQECTAHALSRPPPSPGVTPQRRDTRRLYQAWHSTTGGATLAHPRRGGGAPANRACHQEGHHERWDGRALSFLKCITWVEPGRAARSHSPTRGHSGGGWGLWERASTTSRRNPRSGEQGVLGPAYTRCGCSRAQAS